MFVYSHNSPTIWKMSAFGQIPLKDLRIYYFPHISLKLNSWVWILEFYEMAVLKLNVISTDGWNTGFVRFIDRFTSLFCLPSDSVKLNVMTQCRVFFSSLFQIIALYLDCIPSCAYFIFTTNLTTNSVSITGLRLQNTSSSNIFALQTIQRNPFVY